MPEWNQTIDLKAARKQYEQDRDFPAYRDTVVKTIEESGWLGTTPYPDTLRDHLAGLKASDSVAVGDYYWSAIYDVADEDRVWIETF